MAEQEDKKSINCFTQIRFFAVLAIGLFRNSPNQVLWVKETYRDSAKILGIYLSELGEKSRSYPSIKVHVK